MNCPGDAFFIFLEFLFIHVCSSSIAFNLFCQSLTPQLSTSALNWSMESRSTGFGTEAYLPLKVVFVFSIADPT